HLPRLTRGEPGDALELPQLILLGRLQLPGLAVEVALAVLEGGLAPFELGEPHGELLLLAEDALLDPHDLGAPFTQLVLDRLANGRGRRRGCGAGGGCMPIRGRLRRARWRASRGLGG